MMTTGLRLTLAFALTLPAATLAEDADAPLPPEEAARTMILPDGFQATLFAGEPDVRQPIAFCIDDRGRLWVAENYNYPNHGTKAGDRILIFEDSDGDGRFDERTVFYDKLNYVSGIEVGFGGAWVMSPPYFYFIPDKDGDDKPDSEPTVLLDGFGIIKPDLLTHGSNIVGLAHNAPGCTMMQGTSISCSIVSASVALALSQLDPESRSKVQNGAFIKYTRAQTKQTTW